MDLIYAHWIAHDHLSDNAIYDFSKKAVENGLDIFRVFDSLNYMGGFSFCITFPPLLTLIQRTFVIVIDMCGTGADLSTDETWD